MQPGGHCRVVQCPHGHGKQGGIGSPRSANGKGCHRNPFGHLHNRIKRINTAQMAAGNRHTQHRHHRFSRQHAWQMGCTARTGNDRLQTPALR